MRRLRLITLLDCVPIKALYFATLLRLLGAEYGESCRAVQFLFAYGSPGAVCRGLQVDEKEGGHDVAPASGGESRSR